MDQELAIILRRGGDHAGKRAAWEVVFAAWRDSGLGVHAFCHQHGIPAKRFFRWRSRCQVAAPAAAGGFLPVEVTSLPPGDGRIEIHIGVARLWMPAGTSLQQVVLALKEAAC